MTDKTELTAGAVIAQATTKIFARLDSLGVSHISGPMRKFAVSEVMAILCETGLPELIEALQEAVSAAEFIVGICEDDVAKGVSPNPEVRSMPHAALAHCYAATAFIGTARDALAKVKGE